MASLRSAASDRHINLFIHAVEVAFLINPYFLGFSTLPIAQIFEIKPTAKFNHDVDALNRKVGACAWLLIILCFLFLLFHHNNNMFIALAVLEQSRSTVFKWKRTKIKIMGEVIRILKG